MKFDIKKLKKEYDNTGKESINDVINKNAKQILEDYDEYYDDVKYAILVRAIQIMQESNTRYAVYDKVDKVFKDNSENNLKKVLEILSDK